MQLRRACLPEDLNRQRLATPGFAEALCRLFFSLSCAQNSPTRSAAVDTVCGEFRFRRYEKFLIKLGHRRGRSGGNGWLRPDKEAGGNGAGGADRFAVRPSWL